MRLTAKVRYRYEWLAEMYLHYFTGTFHYVKEETRILDERLQIVDCYGALLQVPFVSRLEQLQIGWVNRWLKCQTLAALE